MALNTFTHAVLSAGLVSDPELALGSGYQATGSTSRVVSLTAGTPDYNSVAGVAPGENPIPAPGIGTVGHPTLSGTIGLDTLGAIGGHPVTQLLYNPPPKNGATAAKTNDPVASPYATGTDLCKGYGNLNEVGGKSKVFTYRLVSPDSTETFSFHKPHLKHVGDTFVSSSLSGITVALRTGPAQAGKSKFVVHGDQHKGVEVQYYLGDPLGNNADASGNGMTLSAGLSSDDSGLAVGPEHARKRLLGFN